MTHGYTKIATAATSVTVISCVMICVTAFCSLECAGFFAMILGFVSILWIVATAGMAAAWTSGAVTLYSDNADEIHGYLKASFASSLLSSVILVKSTYVVILYRLTCLLRFAV
eukprot:m.102906 g.102906  ORF g.102906 m.102906 type:complete len:113 (+) comp37185_c0_seq32:361-699(+)